MAFKLYCRHVLPGLYLADLTSDLPRDRGLVWQSGLLALVTITASAPLACVLWDCGLAGDSPAPWSPLALGLPAPDKQPHLSCSLTVQDFWSPEMRSLAVKLCMALDPTAPHSSRLNTKCCKTLGQVTALQHSVTSPAAIMTPEHFSGVWERLWEFICQIPIIFATYLKGLHFKY